MKKIVLFLFILLQYGFAQFDSLSMYYPLQTGNVWIYAHTDGNNTFYRIKTVKGDTLINAVQYKIVEYVSPYIRTPQLSFERYDTLNATIHALSFEGETLLDSLQAPENLIFGKRRILSSIFIDTIVGIQTVTRDINDLIIPMQYHYYYSYGIGESYFQYNDEDSYPWKVVVQFKLVYANINGKEYGTNPLTPKMDSLALYHPLQNGNKWIYKTTTYHPGSASDISYFTKSVLGDTTIENALYKKVMMQDYGSPNLGYDYYRFDSVSGNFYSYENGEILLDSTRAFFDQTVLGMYGTLRLESVRSDSVLGTLRPVRFIKPWNIVAEKDRGWSYAYGLGLISEYIADLPPSPVTDYKTELVYAKINGKEYGTNPLYVERTSDALPDNFSLSQNFPNPFNPTTVINFQLPMTNYVNLKIFDALGRKVATLVNEVKPTGAYQVTFDASTLASGLYFYQLRAGNFIQTKKMLLTK